MAGIQGPAIGTVATSAVSNQTVDVNKWGGTATTLGQKAMSASVPVAIASDQTAFPVSQSGTWNIGTVTTITTANLAAETTKVIGTVRTVGNVGAVMDGVNTAATAPANGLLTLGIYNSTEPSPTTGQSVGVQLDSKGRTRNVIMDAAGNTRGANVDSSNRLSVTLDNIAAAQTLATVTTVTNLGASNAAATIATDGVTPTVPGIAAYGFVKTPGANTWDRTYAVVNATDTTGTGIPAAGILAQFDDTSPGTVTENRFGNVRMSVRREVYNQIRDAAGNERGANVNASNQLAIAGPVTVASGGIASGAIASGAVASGAVASGAFASGSIASGAIASGAIAAGAIATGATSIAENEDVASANADTMVKVGQIRQDTPVANAGVSNDGDYLNFRADNFGKTWVSATVNEDVAHVAAEPITASGSRRIATLASSAGTDADWATVNQTAEGAAWSTLAGTATPNGLSVGNFTSGDTYTALTNAAQVIKASAGNLYGYYIYNPNSSATYVMIYNIAAASVTVGTSTATLVFCIPATGGANLMFPVPIPFSNAGWSIAAATTGGGATAPAIALEAMVFYL